MKEMAVSNLFLASLLATSALVCNVHGLPALDEEAVIGLQLEDSNVGTVNGLGSDQRRSWQEFVDEVPKEDEELRVDGEKLEQRSSQSEQSRAEEIKILKALVAQQQQLLETQKTAIETQKADLQSVMQQVDSLVLQDAKTLKLIGSQSNKDEGLSVGTYSSVSSRTEVVTTGGVHYIRWGRNVCPHTAINLYRGYTAGNYYSSTAGGVNTLCLHEEPQWGSYNDAAGVGNYIYGAEYYFADMPFSTRNNGGTGLTYHDVPCVACHTPVRSSQIMIPARRECPVGWTMEYRGYLVSNSAGSYTRGDYICVDEEPETKVAGHLTQYGMFLSPVKAQCGSLSCPKYVNGRQIACIVCTK